jgi:hypothetical protein
MWIYILVYLLIGYILGRGSWDLNESILPELEKEKKGEAVNVIVFALLWPISFIITFFIMLLVCIVGVFYVFVIGLHKIVRKKTKSK